MKTNSEIEAEARQLTLLGRQYQSEQRAVMLGDNVVALPRVLLTLPEPQVATPTARAVEGETAFTGRAVRHIEADLAGGELVFRLMERETDHAGLGEGVPFVVLSSNSAYEALRTGYELVEEEHLAAQLERFAERSEDRPEPADGETVAEVAAILEADLLPFAEQLRTKAEIVEFLSGRLEPSVFIAHAVERQRERDRHVERCTQRHEIKLTLLEN